MALLSGVSQEIARFELWEFYGNSQGKICKIFAWNGLRDERRIYLD